MNKKSVEGLPLKYLIMVIVAVLVIDLILEMTNVVKGGVLSSLYNLGNITNDSTAALASNITS